jgi:hypothetical protein
MAKLKNDKHKEYARYAALCLNTPAGTSEQDAIHRAMAAEWIKLADEIRHPLEQKVRT